MSPSSHSILQDRTAAGRRLVETLRHYVHRADVIFLASSQGGVPVAYDAIRGGRIPVSLL